MAEHIGEVKAAKLLKALAEGKNTREISDDSDGDSD